MTVDLKPFVESFPAERISHHFVGQDQARGIYAKELRIPKGFLLVSHAHTYDHLSILGSGLVILTVDGKDRSLVGPCAIAIVAGKHHSVRAITEAVWYCIHPTDETDPDRVDDVILRAS